MSVCPEITSLLTVPSDNCVRQTLFPSNKAHERCSNKKVQRPYKHDKVLNRSSIMLRGYEHALNIFFDSPIYIFSKASNANTQHYY